MNSGQGFEFTPAGIVPLGTYREGQAEGSIAGATAIVPVMHPPVETRTIRFDETGITIGPAPTLNPAPALKPANIVKLAKVRLREVERDIKRLKKLEIERDELKRLLAAAAGKPLAVVRPIRTA